MKNCPVRLEHLSTDARLLSESSSTT